MRKRAREEQQRGQYEDLIRTGGTPETKTAPVETDRHINFFADMKTGVSKLLLFSYITYAIILKKNLQLYNCITTHIFLCFVSLRLV